MWDTTTRIVRMSISVRFSMQVWIIVWINLVWVCVISSVCWISVMSICLGLAMLFVSSSYSPRIYWNTPMRITLSSVWVMLVVSRLIVLVSLTVRLWMWTTISKQQATYCDYSPSRWSSKWMRSRVTTRSWIPNSRSLPRRICRWHITKYFILAIVWYGIRI